MSEESNHPAYIVRFKDTISDDDYKKAMEDIRSQGGSITHEYVLFRGFTAKMPDDHVGTLSGHPHVEHVEKDQEVKIA